MSVCAVKKVGDQIEIAADSIRVSGWQTKEKDPSGKIWKIGPDLIAATAGLCSMGGVFREYIENHKPKQNTEWGWLNLMSEFYKYAKGLDGDLKPDTNSFLVVYKGKIFEIHEMFVKQVKKFTAIGAGRDFALAAMQLKHSAKQAVAIACELSCFCSKPIVGFTMAVKKKGK